LAVALAGADVLEDLGVELIGAPVDVIRRAEDREEFRDAVRSCGLEVPASRIVTDGTALGDVSLPAVVRPAFTLGGHGGGFADTLEELERQGGGGLAESPIGQVLVEGSVRGGGGFGLEGVRGPADNVVGGGAIARSYGTAPTTSSSSARSRTSIRWACTRATRSPSRPR